RRQPATSRMGATFDCRASLSHGTLAYLIFGMIQAPAKLHGQPRNHVHRNHAGGAAQGLCVWHLSHGRERGRPRALLDRAGEAGRHSARSFHMPSRLPRTRRSDRFTVTVDRDFDAVLEGCAEPRPGRPRTWINTRIRVLYRKLYERRHCHSLEVYEGENLVGGLYGVTLGRA